MKLLIVLLTLFLCGACKTVSDNNVLAGGATKYQPASKVETNSQSDALKPYMARVSEMNSTQLAAESSKLIVTFRRLMFDLNLEPQNIQQTGEAEGSFESRGLFHSAKGEFNAKYGEGLRTKQTLYKGIIINGSEIEKTKNFLIQQRNDEFIRVSMLKFPINSLLELEKSASSKVDNVKEQYQNTKLLTDKIRFVLLKAEESLNSLEKGSRDYNKLVSNINWGQHTAVQINFRVDTDSMDVSCKEDSYARPPNVCIKDRSDSESPELYQSIGGEDHIKDGKYGIKMVKRLY